MFLIWVGSEPKRVDGTWCAHYCCQQLLLFCQKGSREGSVKKGHNRTKHPTSELKDLQPACHHLMLMHFNRHWHDILLRPFECLQNVHQWQNLFPGKILIPKTIKQIKSSWKDLYRNDQTDQKLSWVVANCFKICEQTNHSGQLQSCTNLLHVHQVKWTNQLRLIVCSSYNNRH